MTNTSDEVVTSYSTSIDINTNNNTLYKPPPRGKCCSDRAQTNAAMKRMLDGSKRSSVENVYEPGPLLVSDVPKSCRGEASRTKIHMGIDEAGRGPVLGPMVYGAAYWSSLPITYSSEEEDPRSLFRDSKTLDEKTRSTLFDAVQRNKDIGYVVRVLHASEISRNMLRRNKAYNLNQMSHDAVIEMIDAVVRHSGVDVDTCYVDTVGSPEFYQKKLEAAFSDTDVRFVVEKKADAKYASCSAASVLAKVTRDRIVHDWQWSEPESAVGTFGSDFGSGYPSDPKCKAWMGQDLGDPVFGFPDLVRFSWGPAKLALGEKGAKVEWADDDQDYDPNQPSMSSFFNDAAGTKRKRLGYLDNMGLEVVPSIVKT